MNEALERFLEAFRLRLSMAETEEEIEAVAADAERMIIETACKALEELTAGDAIDRHGLKLVGGQPK